MSVFGDGTPKQNLLDNIMEIISDSYDFNHPRIDILDDLLDVVRHVGRELMEEAKNEIRDEVRAEVKRDLRERLF